MVCAISPTGCRRVGCNGHVNNGLPDYVGNLALQLSFPHRRPRDRPKTRWKDVILMEMHDCQVTDNDVEDIAKWRKN